MSSSEVKKLNLDTSVITNFIFSSLPGDLESDRGSHRIINDETYFTVIGGKAKNEFEALCDRRNDLYQDVIEFILETSEDIFSYEPNDRGVHTSPNDRSHFRWDIQASWHDKTEEEQLSLLRRCTQQLELYQINVTKEHIDQCFEKQSNPVLLQCFEDELDIGDDCEILVDAVEISKEYAIHVLVAIDSDLTEPANIAVIKSIIEEECNPTPNMDIVEPDNV